jgi:hypothetical protein
VEPAAVGRTAIVGTRRGRRLVPDRRHPRLRPGADAGNPRQGVRGSAVRPVRRPGIGILAGGAVANVLGTPAAVGLSGVAGVFVAAGLATSWTRLRRQVIASQRPPQDANYATDGSG